MPNEGNNQLPTTTTPGSQPDAGAGGVPQGGMPTSGTPDAGKPDKSQFVPVEDLRKLQSKLDQREAEQKRRYDDLLGKYQELEQIRVQNETEGLTDEELAIYEAKREQYSAQKAAEDARREADKFRYERDFMNLRNFYLSKGAPREIVAMDDPAAMQAALLDWQNDRYNKVAAELEALKSGKTTGTPATQPPTVTTHTPAASSVGKLRWADIPVGSDKEKEVLGKLQSGTLKPEDIE